MWVHNNLHRFCANRTGDPGGKWGERVQPPPQLLRDLAPTCDDKGGRQPKVEDIWGGFVIIGRLRRGSEVITADVGEDYLMRQSWPSPSANCTAVASVQFSSAQLSCRL